MKQPMAYGLRLTAYRPDSGSSAVGRQPSALFVLCSSLFALCFLGCPSRRAAPVEGQFGRLGAKKLATIAVACQQMTDFVFSPNGQKVIYTGWLSPETRHPTSDTQFDAGIWVGDSLIARADSVYEIGFTQSNEPYFIGSDSGRAFLYYRYARPRAYDEVTNPEFGRDGNYLSYMTTSGARRTLVVANGASRAIGGVLDYALCPTSERFAYAARDSGDWIVVEDNDTSDIYDWVQSMTYSRDGSTLAYAALADDEWFAVVNGRELDALDSNTVEVSDVVMNDFGNHIAYVVAEMDEKTPEVYQYVVVDDYQSDIYTEISDPVFSPRGDNFAFVADDGDGQFAVTPAGEEPAYDEVWGIAFSPDGVHVAYVARDGEDELMVVDGVERYAYDAMDKAAFARDGRRYGYGALDGNDFLWVVGAVQ